MPRCPSVGARPIPPPAVRSSPPWTTRAAATPSAPTRASTRVYRALAVAAGRLRQDHRPDLSDTAPAVPIGPFPQWGDPRRIVSLDPWGHLAAEAFAAPAALGWDIRPTIAVTRAHLNMPEIGLAMRLGRLQPDGEPC